MNKSAVEKKSIRNIIISSSTGVLACRQLEYDYKGNGSIYACMY